MKNKFKGTAALLLATIIWGSAFVAQSVGMEYIGPFTFQTIRCLLAVIVLSLAVSIREPKAFLKKLWNKDLWKTGILCGTALFVAASLQQIGLLYTEAGKAGFLTALYIVIVPLLGLFFKKRVPAAVWAGVVIAAAGTYLLSVTEDFTIGRGDLLVILCAVCFSGHILLVDHFSPKVSGVELSAAQFLVTGILSTVAALFAETVSLADILHSAGPILYTALLSSGVAYTLQIVGQKETPPAVASLVMSLESVFAALSGWLFLKQGMQPREFLGCVLVFAAVILAQIPFDELKTRLKNKKAGQRTE